MFTFKKAVRTQAKARVAIDGPSGSGKTYTSLVLATELAGGGKIAVIDTERGSASLYSDKFNFDVLELNEFSPATYVQAIHAAQVAGYKVIVIDSLSHAWEGEGGALEMVDNISAKSKSNNSYFAWRDVTPLHRKLVDAMLQSTCHIVATMRSKTEYVIETVNGKQVPHKIGMAPIQRAGMEYEFTVVADMDIDHKIVISKSRCDLLADKVTMKPNAEFWNPFVTWLNSGEAPAPVVIPQPKAEKSFREKLIDRYTEVMSEAAVKGVNVKLFELADNMTDDEIKELGVSLHAEINKIDNAEKAVA